MSPGLLLWLKVSAGTAIAVVGLLASPPMPRAHGLAALAPLEGAGAGLLLYVALVRTRPRAPLRVARVRIAVCKYIILGVLAANEEVVWRRVVLGELLRAGSLAAVAGSTLMFALAHRARPALHLGTGLTFGAVYAATGALAASVGAHWVYNSLLAAFGERRPLGESGGGVEATG